MRKRKACISGVFRPLAVLVLAVVAAQAQVRLKIHLDRVVQADYLGVNAVYHGFAFMPEEEARQMSDADRAREFDRVSRMGLHIARTWYRPDWACGSSLGNAPDWESPKMQAFYRWLAEMRRRGVDVALQAGWWFTRDTYLGSWAPDPARDLERYSRWVSESVHQMVELRGFGNVKFLVLFTEPTSYGSGAVPSGETQWSYYVKMMRAIDRRLRADGRRGLVRLVGPNNSRGGLHLKEAVAGLNDVIDVYSGHDYNRSGYDEWFALCRKMADIVASTGKPLWLDEFGKQDEAYRKTGAYGSYLAQIVAASINAGLQTSFQWLLFDQLYVAPLDHASGKDSFYGGVHRWGACKWPHDAIEDAASCYPQWDAVSLMSKYLGGGSGTRAFECESGGTLRIAATSPGGSGLSVLVVNTAESPRRFSIDLLKHHGECTLHRHLYDPGNSGAQAPEVTRRCRKRVKDTLPAGGVAIYTTMDGLP